MNKRTLLAIGLSLSLASKASSEGPIVKSVGTLKLTAPVTSVDGSPLTDLKEFRATFRRHPTANDEYDITYTIPSSTIAPTASMIAAIRLFGSAAKPLRLEDGQWYVQVVAISLTGLVSVPTPWVPFYLLNVAPNPPLNVTVSE